MLVDIERFAELRRNFLTGFLQIFGNNLITEPDTFIANVDSRAGNEFSNLIPVLSTEGATKIGICFGLSCHKNNPPLKTREP
jgi:hypothetical protein